MSLVFDVFEYWLQALVLSVQEWLPQPSGRALQHSLPCCDLSTTAHCSTTAQVFTALHCTNLHKTALHNSTQHCTAQVFTTLQCTTLNCTKQLSTTAVQCTTVQ